MKRFSLVMRTGIVTKIAYTNQMIEHDEGKYVYYEEAQALIDELKSIIK